MAVPVTTKGPNMIEPDAEIDAALNAALFDSTTRVTMPDADASKLDAWRAEEARKLYDRGFERTDWVRVYGEYRRLVREDVHPPAEPDQDTQDTRAVLAAYWGDEDGKAVWIFRGDHDESDDFVNAKAALIAIKARVRDEVAR